jgi:hypothetical protein
LAQFLDAPQDLLRSCRSTHSGDYGTMRELSLAAANVKLEAVTLDAGATVPTLYSQQMGRGREL